MSALFLAAVVAAALVCAAGGCNLGYYFDASWQGCLYCSVGSYGLQVGAANGCASCPAGQYGASRLGTPSEACGSSCPSPWSEQPAAGARYCAVKSGTYTVYSALQTIIPSPYMKYPTSIILVAPAGWAVSISPEIMADNRPLYSNYYTGDIALYTYTATESSFTGRNRGFMCFEYRADSAWRSASYAKYGSKQVGEGAYRASNASLTSKGYGSTTVNTTYDDPEAGAARRVAYGEWVQIALPREIQVGQVVMRCGDRTRAPSDLVVLGSNDGTVWSLLSEQQVEWTAHQQTKTFRMETGYRWRVFRFFRVVVRATGMSTDGEAEIGAISLLEFEFIACQPGTFSTRYADNRQAQGCETCAKGTYAPEAASDQCTPCPPGTWGGTAGSTSLASCTQCGLGKYSASAGATVGSVCQNCPSGTYSSEQVGSALCTHCPPGTWGGPAGSVGLASCTQCGPGTFSGAIGAASASACGAVDYPTAAYATSYGLTSDLGCIPCRAGRYGNAVGCDLCTPCPAGTYSGVVGMAGGIAGCVKCGAGKYSATAGATGSSECAVCVAGAYSSGAGISNSSACTRCGAGAFAASAGSSACSVCGTGEFSGTDGATKCDRCAAGAYAYDNGTTACFLCDAGRFSNATGLTSCAACSAGTYAASAGMSVCPPCPAGSIASASGRSGCVQCAAGGYGASSGLTVCAECSAGRYSSALGLSSNTQCTQCQQGKHSGVAGLVNGSGCVGCRAGTYSLVLGLTSSAGCLQCDAGGYSLGGGSACDKCQAGSFSNVSGLVSSAGCLLCDAGRYATGTGLESSAKCLLCEAGAYSTGTGLQSGARCVKCGAGTYSALPGATGPETCTQASPGAYCTGTGLRFADECLPCGAGTYAAGSGGSSQAVCEPCQRGQHQPLTGRWECVACPAGQYANEPGRTACALCTTVAPIPGVFMARQCQATRDVQWSPCSACDAGARVLQPCTTASDTQCAWGKCSRVNTTQREYSGWWSSTFRCPPGQYLRGFDAELVLDCRQCPAEMVGRNGKYCEVCDGPLEEPYALDQSLCVCKAPAVMSSEGGECVCPAGRYFETMRGRCSPCRADTFGTPDGICSLCAAGTFSYLGATVCTRCEAGKYRLSGTDNGQGCRSCNEAANGGQGNYAPDPGAALCVKCNRSCAGADGWRDAGECPGGGGVDTGEWRVCAPCDWKLPGNATWISSPGGCVYACNTGFYREAGTGSCVKCSTEACAAGFAWSDCSADADRGCDAECRNESKPAFHSKWVAMRTMKEGKCPWACEDGYVDTVSDYWMFQIRECVPRLGR